MIQQIAFEIPLDITVQLIDGEYIRYGGVVRDSTGAIVRHLKEVPVPAQNQQYAIANIANALKDPKVITVIGLGAIAVIGIVAYVKKAKSARKNVEPETPECVERYNASLCSYLESIRIGNLSVETIDYLISGLDGIKENLNEGRISIEFSAGQLDTLVNLVFNYTRSLQEANSINPDELKAPELSSADSSILELRSYLETQKQIFRNAA